MNPFDITEILDDTASENKNRGTSSWSSAGDQYGRKMSAAATQGGSKPDNNFKSSARIENNIFHKSSDVTFFERENRNRIKGGFGDNNKFNLQSSGGPAGIVVEEDLLTWSKERNVSHCYYVTLGYKRVFLPLCKVADTPFHNHIQQVAEKCIYIYIYMRC